MTQAGWAGGNFSHRLEEKESAQPSFTPGEFGYGSSPVLSWFQSSRISIPQRLQEGSGHLRTSISLGPA